MSITSEDITFDPPPSQRENEMARLLDLINAEWTSDPTSVACFDLRIVEGVRKVLGEHKRATARERRYQRAFR